MWVLPIRVKFRQGIPELRFLERRLTETTGVHVTVVPFQETAGCTDYFIHFRPGNTGKFDGCVRLSISTDTISVEPAQDDSLQKCPNYFFFHTLAALEDSGGTPHFGVFQGYRNQKLQQEIPAYARVCWAEWVKLNGGTTPPTYKKLLVLAQLLIGILLGIIIWVPYLLVLFAVGSMFVGVCWVIHVAWALWATHQESQGKAPGESWSSKVAWTIAWFIRGRK